MMEVGDIQTSETDIGKWIIQIDDSIIIFG